MPKHQDRRPVGTPRPIKPVTLYPVWRTLADKWGMPWGIPPDQVIARLQGREAA